MGAELPVLDVSYGFIKAGPPAVVKEACARAVRGTWPGYLPREGIPALRDAIAGWERERIGVAVEPAQVVVTAGASLALLSAFAVVPGVKVLIPDPGFPHYARALTLLQKQPVPYSVYPLVDFEAIEKGLRAGARALVWNVPHNPTGLVPPEEDVARLMGLLSHHGALCISDEVYREFAGKGLVSPFSLSPDGTILVYSFSKSFSLASLRVGYAVAAQPIASAIAAAQWTAAMSVSWIAQLSALAAVRFGHDHLRQLSVEMAEKRDLATRLLHAEGLSCFPLQGGIFACVTTEDTGLTATAAVEGCWREERIVLTNCEHFGPSARFLIRMCLGGPEGEIRESIRRVSRFLKRVSGRTGGKSP